MKVSRRSPPRNLFEIENARNLTRDEIVATFIPTQAFWRLLAPKNHIVLGARGSGKTVLAKMLSYDHLSHFRHPSIESLVASRELMGMYVPTSIEWVGGLRNKPWQSDGEAEEFFQWRLNVSTCLAFLSTMSSCLENEFQDKSTRARIEDSLSKSLVTAWLDSDFPACQQSLCTLRELKKHLEAIEHRKQQQLARQRVLGSASPNEPPVGLSFGVDLFRPLRRAISIATDHLDLPSKTTWLLCLDEAEFLLPLHHRILNSHLRATSPDLVFKITTMPYFHHTLDTNAGVPLNVGHDFEYVYIDQDPITLDSTSGEEGRKFATDLFNHRAKASRPRYRGLTLKGLLGDSDLLDPSLSDWGADSSNLQLLKKHANDKTVQRADRLAHSALQFRDQIARKIHGALLLKEAIQSHKGHEDLDIYSGDSMAIRCGDANPRRLIRIFNSFLLEAKRPDNTVAKKLSKNTQTRILMAFSTSTLTRIQSEPECGTELYKFLSVIGTYMNRSLHRAQLGTDQVLSFSIDGSISPDHWKLIQRAVGLGLLFPNVSAKNPDHMPEKEGTFHLAYVLSPHFQLLPRRGKSRSLISILSSSDSAVGQKGIFDHTDEEA